VENRNEDNSLEQNHHAYEQLRTLLPSTSALPPIPVCSQLPLDKEVTGRVASSDPVSDWNIDLLLGHQRGQQSAVQFYYGERPPAMSGNKGKGKRVQAPLGDVDVVVKKRKTRTCATCKQSDCPGAYMSRPCNNTKVCRMVSAFAWKRIDVAILEN